MCSDFFSWSASANQAQYEDINKHAQSVAGVFFTVNLVATTSPPWPEESEREEVCRRQQGQETQIVPKPDQSAAMAQVTVALPDRLMCCGYPNTNLPQGFDYYIFSVPTTFFAAQPFIPRRMNMRLTLKCRKQAMEPVFCALQPSTDITQDKVHIGDVALDLGKLLNAVYPVAPDILALKFGGAIDRNRLKPKVQAGGINSRSCQWYIADQMICYNMNPRVMVQIPKGETFAVSAELEVEVERRWLAGIWHKLYAKSASPRTYMLERDNPHSAISTGEPDRLALVAGNLDESVRLNQSVAVAKAESPLTQSLSQALQEFLVGALNENSGQKPINDFFRKGVVSGTSIDTQVLNILADTRRKTQSPNATADEPPDSQKEIDEARASLNELIRLFEERHDRP